MKKIIIAGFFVIAILFSSATVISVSNQEADISTNKNMTATVSLGSYDGTVYGTITVDKPSGNEPAKNAPVSCYKMPLFTPWFHWGGAGATTDENGHYVITGVPCNISKDGETPWFQCYVYYRYNFFYDAEGRSDPFKMPVEGMSKEINFHVSLILHFTSFRSTMQIPVNQQPVEQTLITNLPNNLQINQ